MFAFYKVMLPPWLPFSLFVNVKEKGSEKETGYWPPHGLARNFPTKLPCE